jgi:hypothetical protein
MRQKVFFNKQLETIQRVSCNSSNNSKHGKQSKSNTCNKSCLLLVFCLNLDETLANICRVAGVVFLGNAINPSSGSDRRLVKT